MSSTITKNQIIVNDSLPENWLVKPIGEVCKFEKGKKPKNTGKQSEIRNVPYINIKAFESGISEEYAEPGNYPECSKDDVLIVWDGARSGLVGRGVAGYIGSTLSRVWSELTKNKYLFYFLKLHYDYINTNTKGVGIPHVDPGILNAIKFPIAPPNEQKIIVAEIEKQFSRLDEAVANLKRVKANLKRYKAAVLKAAVEGKLTEEWRLSARAENRRRAQVEELESIPKAQKGRWFIYIIECDNGSYYVGHTADLHARWKAHCEGKAADWTKKYMPKYLVHYEIFGNKEEAVKREKDLKTGYGRTWRKREIEAGRIKPLVHNPDNETALPVHGVQTGSELLKRILAERREKWEEAELSKMRAKGKEPKDDKWKKKYKEPALLDTSKLPKIPKGWIWATTDQLFTFVTSGSRGWAKYYSDSGPLFLRMGNLDHDTIKLDLSDIQHVSPPDGTEGTRTRVMSGDILISITADIGMIGLIPDKFKEAYINQHVALSRASSFANSTYIAWFLASTIGQDQLTKLQRGATKVGLGLDDIRAVNVPVPPLTEQKKMIEEIERFFSIAEGIDTTAEINLKRIGRLRQSIMKKAFSGQLL